MAPINETATQLIKDRRSPYDLYHPWKEPTRLFATVARGGFLIEGHVVPELRGRIIKTRFVRKQFVDLCAIFIQGPKVQSFLYIMDPQKIKHTQLMLNRQYLILYKRDSISQ